MDFDALYHANFSKLDSAVTDWSTLVTHLKELEEQARKGLKGAADKADWQGMNAQVSKEFVGKTAGEFADALTEATTVHALLSDTAGELRGFHKQLVQVVSEGSGKGLTVATLANGGFSVVPAPTTDPEGAKSRAEALRDRIQPILDKATQSDSTAAEALQLIVNQAQYGFSDASYKDRDDAADAIAAAKKAEETLKKDPDDVSNTELASLNSILSKHKNDPLFAEKLATDLGPKRTMEFYGEITDDAQFAVNPRSRQGLSAVQKERQKLIGGLETQLGATIGTATHSDSADMAQWKRDAIELGGANVRPGGENKVYGFQVMSNLMRHGTYDGEFLHDYGDALISYEKEHKTDEYGGLQRNKMREDVLPWDRSAQYERLHYGAGNDGGADPMTGFMEAMGHNADASTDFFNSGDNFDYLTEDREWPKDFVSTDAKNVAGYDSLGHALESATTGSAYDAHPPALHRDADTASVAEKVVERYGQAAEGTDEKRTQVSGAALMHKQDGIQDSLGRIGAAYIDDLDWGLDDDDKRSVYAQDGTGRTMDERAHMKSSDVRGFLGTLGQDPEAYAKVGTAQQVYTTSVLHGHPPTLDANGVVHSAAAETAVRTGAEVQGIIDQSRADQLEAEGAAKEAEYNKAVDDQTARNQAIAGAIVGGAFAFMPEPETGAGALLVPIAADTVEGQVSGQIEQNIGDYGESQHRQLGDVRQGESKRIYDAGFTSSWEPGRKTLQGLDGDQWKGDPYYQIRENLKNAQETGYNSGSHAQQQAGNLPVTN
ncbi:hypothetical protein ACIBUY_30460 [Streptomyces sp. NPDC050085]|uniref:hypothetical protein n=1 Tax=Streptomyces sp. NPDC050085 TaxID=3365600 RepID=UPI003798DB79